MSTSPEGHQLARESSGRSPGSGGEVVDITILKKSFEGGGVVMDVFKYLKCCCEKRLVCPTEDHWDQYTHSF